MHKYFLYKTKIEDNSTLFFQKNVRKSIDKIKLKTYNKTKQKIVDNLFCKNKL